MLHKILIEYNYSEKFTSALAFIGFLFKGEEVTSHVGSSAVSNTNKAKIVNRYHT